MIAPELIFAGMQAALAASQLQQFSHAGELAQLKRLRGSFWPRLPWIRAFSLATTDPIEPITLFYQVLQTLAPVIEEAPRDNKVRAASLMEAPEVITSSMSSRFVPATGSTT